jgi:hypothetical protein
LLIIYILSVIINIVGWRWELKREGQKHSWQGYMSLAMLTLMPGLNSVVALAFLSEVFVRW